MFELIKAELAYKKWEYLTLLILPFPLAVLTWLMLQRDPMLEVDSTFCALFGFGAALLIASIRIPFVTHQISVEENRIQLIATLPVSVRAIALSQSLPFLLFTFTFSLFGFLVIGITGLGYSDLPMLLLINCVLLAIGLGLSSLFLKELLTLLPKWTISVFWILFLGLVMFNTYGEIFWQIDMKIFDPRQLTGWLGTVKMMVLGGGCFWGHILLFTHLRGDLSMRRRYT